MFSHDCCNHLDMMAYYSVIEFNDLELAIKSNCFLFSDFHPLSEGWLFFFCIHFDAQFFFFGRLRLGCTCVSNLWEADVESE